MKKLLVIFVGFALVVVFVALCLSWLVNYSNRQHISKNNLELDKFNSEIADRFSAVPDLPEGSKDINCYVRYGNRHYFYVSFTLGSVP